eukprot:bmy_07952T0
MVASGAGTSSNNSSNSSSSSVSYQRRGSNVSLTLDMSSLGNVEPFVATPTPREKVAMEYLQSASRILTRSQLRDVVASSHLLQSEFMEIPMNFVDPKEIDIPCHGTKNRYKTILPNPLSRVCLRPKNVTNSLSTYINANYIRGYSGKEKAFIATQGPMINTVNDFWQMVWQEDSPVIVMITKLKEKNEKCVLYWPEKRGIYGKVEVLVINVNECDNYTVRNLVLKQGSHTQHVKHYWYTSWPDHKTPASAQPLLQLMLDVEEDRLASVGRGPVVVHCSAGIGRTGCFIATSIGCRQLREEGVVDALSIVCQLRVDRSGIEQDFGLLIFRTLEAKHEQSLSGKWRLNFTWRFLPASSSGTQVKGFQIVHVQKQQCLFKNERVVMDLCNGTSQNQQWMWTEDGKLLHVKSALCLGISDSSGGPSRSAIFAPCSRAPRWTCYEKEGFLEVENASLFLKKQGFRVVVKKGRKYLHSWMKIDVNEEGKPVNESLCSKKAGLGAEVSVRSTRNTTPPQIPTTFNALPYSPGHLISNTTETFTRSTTENYSQNSSQRQHPDLQMAGTTSWVPWTTQPFSSTTEEFHSGANYPVHFSPF